MNWNLPARPVVALVGCTGAVGRELIRLIEERRPAFGNIHLLATEQSAGTEIHINGASHVVRPLAEHDFSTTDIAFFAIGAEASAELAPRVTAAGCLVIDKSHAHRMQPECPLIVPQVNAHDMATRPESGIIACPNCSTTPLVRALAPLHHAIGVRSVVVSTYQAASGMGIACIENLIDESRRTLAGEETSESLFPRPLAFNVVPQIDAFCDDGFTFEERKMTLESRKILGDPRLAVTATTVRVPVLNVHSEAVYVEFARPVTRAEVIAQLKTAPDFLVAERDGDYATPRFLPDANAVAVGRIRVNPDDARGVWMWLVADNLRPGAALNALQIVDLAMVLSEESRSGHRLSRVTGKPRNV